MARLVAVLTLVTLVACGASNREPAWPKRTDPEVDGGESLAPRTASVVAASATEKKETKTEEKADDKDKPADAKAADKDKPADAKPTTTTITTDDVIIIDDIIIEIEE
jgi:hypothetical protein